MEKAVAEQDAISLAQSFMELIGAQASINLIQRTLSIIHVIQGIHIDLLNFTSFIEWYMYNRSKREE